MRLWECAQGHSASRCTLVVFLEVKVLNGEGSMGIICPRLTVGWDIVLMMDMAPAQPVEAGASYCGHSWTLTDGVLRMKTSISLLILNIKWVT